MQELFLTCPGGLETICENELKTLGILNTRIKPGGVSIFGEEETIFKINLWTRTGVRLLVKIDHFECRNKNELYQGVHQIDWNSIFTTQNTFSVNGFFRSEDESLRNTHYATLVCKDAIVDRFKKDCNSRPDVNKHDPQFHIFVHVHHNRGTVYLNSSGAPLYKRGYRRGKMHKASMNEALAAGIMLLTEWNGSTPLYDPMCGSGTLSIEAMMIAANYAPGLIRSKFAFMNWKFFDPHDWNYLTGQAKDSIKRQISPEIFASDIRRDALQMAKENYRNIRNLSHDIMWDVQSVTELEPDENPGIIVMNPPYGERTGELESLKILYKGIGDMLKNNCQGYSAYLFTASSELMKQVGLKTSRRIPLRNGNLDCRLLKYDLYAGSKKGKYMDNKR